VSERWMKPRARASCTVSRTRPYWCCNCSASTEPIADVEDYQVRVWVFLIRLNADRFVIQKLPPTVSVIADVFGSQVSSESQSGTVQSLVFLHSGAEQVCESHQKHVRVESSSSMASVHGTRDADTLRPQGH
jgi:hypothetical protein